MCPSNTSRQKVPCSCLTSKGSQRRLNVSSTLSVSTWSVVAGGSLAKHYSEGQGTYPSLKIGAVYAVPCSECDHLYIGKTGRILEKWLTEHRATVKRNNWKNRIAVHAWETGHQVKWESATVKEVKTSLAGRRVMEALYIQWMPHTTNLNCGLTIDPIWFPLLTSLVFMPNSKYEPSQFTCFLYTTDEDLRIEISCTTDVSLLWSAPITTLLINTGTQW